MLLHKAWSSLNLIWAMADYTANYHMADFFGNDIDLLCCFLQWVWLMGWILNLISAFQASITALSFQSERYLRTFWHYDYCSSSNCTSFLYPSSCGNSIFKLESILLLRLTLLLSQQLDQQLHVFCHYAGSVSMVSTMFISFWVSFRSD